MDNATSDQEASDTDIVSRGTVLVTGGSRGIGASIAERLAGRRHDLVLVARTKDELRTEAERIRERYGITVTAIAVDLTKPGIADTLRDQLVAKDIAIAGLVNNAGFGQHARFADSGETARKMVALNVTALTELTRVFLPDIERAKGFVINVASVAGLVPIPEMAVYSATKAYVVEFSESLSLETSARVLCVCPGMVETRFHEIANTGSKSFSRAPKGKSPEQVAAETMHALDRRAVVHVTDPQLRWMLRLLGWMPRSWIRAAARRMAR